MDQLIGFVSRFLLYLSNQTEQFFRSIDLASHPYYYVDILVVAILFYFLFVVVKGTRAVHILTGFAVLGTLSFASRSFHLSALDWILGNFMTMMVIAIPVVFQDEFRRGLEKIGQTKLLPERIKEEGRRRVIRQVVEACQTMAEQKIGATIVFARDVSLREYIETGVSLEANVSSELLSSLFYPSSPLHDGAVIIQGERIVAASCVLPLALKGAEFKYGMRHKSALGISDQTDALTVIVSEERGHISLANGGALTTNLDTERLENILVKALIPERKFFSFRKHVEETAKVLPATLKKARRKS